MKNGNINSNHIFVILVEPENPDNIGATARAMKNMGFKNLRLVSPHEDWQSRAKKMAVSAGDVLEKAEVYNTLKEAVADLKLTVGTSRRTGGRRGVFWKFQKAIDELTHSSLIQKTGILFGKESKGLSNAHLAACDWITAIPSSPEYPSLNLAQAVMVVCFSLSNFEDDSDEKGRKLDFLNKRDMNKAFDWFEKAVESLNYKPVISKRIMTTFQAMVKRSGLISSEGEMIKGLSRRIVDRECWRNRDN